MEARTIEADFGGREVRTFPFVVEEVRDSGAGEGQYTVRGHAAVFDKWSLDLGGFREKVAPGAFDNVLSTDPHVIHTWDHDSRYTFSSTRNKTLELRTDPVGLHFWSRVAPTSYADDMRVLLERGDIDQASFMFTIARDEWHITGEGDDEMVERIILEVAELFDVCTCAMGAYPTTDSELVGRALRYAVDAGKLAEEAVERLQPAQEEEDAAPPEAGEEEPPESRQGDGDEEAAPKDGGLDLKALKRQAREDTRDAKVRYLHLDRRT